MNQLAPNIGHISKHETSTILMVKFHSSQNGMNQKKFWQRPGTPRSDDLSDTYGLKQLRKEDRHGRAKSNTRGHRGNPEGDRGGLLKGRT